jgi:hypothetical protein
VSHTLSFESVAEYKGFQVNPKLEFFAYGDRGVGAFQALNFHLKLSRVFALTFVNQGEYTEREHKYSVSNGLSLGQEVSETQALSYNLFFLSNNRPNYHLESYSVSVTWSEVLYKKILDYAITPHLDFDDVRRFAGAPGLTFDLNLNF